jgi:hypothetical protein
MSNRTLFINSTIAFAMAALVMFTVHELGHAIAAISFGLHPVVRPFSVDYGTATKTQNIVILLAGPFVSLVLGMIFLAMPRVGKGFWRLLSLWAGLNGVQTFTGYLITAPFGGVGDIGGTLHILNTPLWVGLVIFAVGWIGTFFLGRLATVRFLGFTDPASDIPPQLRSVGLFAWLAGVLVVLIISIGSFDTSIQGIFEVFGVLTSGIYLSLVRYFLPRVKGSGEPLKMQFPVVGSILLVAIALLRLLIFAPGFHL